MNKRSTTIDKISNFEKVSYAMCRTNPIGFNNENHKFVFQNWKKYKRYKWSLYRRDIFVFTCLVVDTSLSSPYTFKHFGHVCCLCTQFDRVESGFLACTNGFWDFQTVWCFCANMKCFCRLRACLHKQL